MKTRNQPATTDGRISGHMMSRNDCSQLAPEFTLLVFGPAPDWAARLGVQVVAIDGRTLIDEQGLATRRYDARPGTAYLLRPDTHVAARWRSPTEAAVRQAMEHALALC